MAFVFWGGDVMVCRFGRGTLFGWCFVNKSEVEIEAKIPESLFERFNTL